MKCTECGADSSVLDTRMFKGMLSRRRRECFNGHVFSTIEVPIGALWKDKYDRIISGTKLRAQAYKRRLAVLKSKGNNSDTAKATGLTEARVRQIRKAALGPNGHSMLNETKLP